MGGYSIEAKNVVPARGRSSPPALPTGVPMRRD